MNDDQVKGRAEQVKGKIKEVTGRVVNNDRLQGEGMVDQVSGKAQATYGDVKENVKDNLKRDADKL
jgi:uncharacterized protein YjbJ (UPF0337 family)